MTCSQDSDCPGTDVCQTSTKGMICRKNDGTTPTPDAGTPTPDTGSATDTTAPKVTIASPTPNAQVSSSTTVKAAATDNVGVTSVELLVDNVSMASKSTPPFDFPIILQNGSHTLTVVAYDKAQNKGQASVSVTVGGGTQPQPDSGTAPPPPQPDTGTTPPPKQDSGVAPPKPGGNNPFGNGCNLAEDCLTKLCAFDPALNVKYCSQQCGVQDWCPPGGVCVQGSGSGAKLCALQLNNNNNPKDQDSGAAGGCSFGAGAASAGSLGLVMLGLMALLLGRRRRE
jgi:MYXO-CTERM domain-containing protein